MRIAIAAILAAGLLAGCASGSGGGEITISSGVWAKFQEYKGQLKPGDDQYFTASSTGGYSWNADKDQALQECQKYSNGGTCVLFAHNDEILVPYHVQH